MVQLNTTYDKELKTKIFVLKGEEAYARTTDVLADIISDYDDCNTRLESARVGLEIDVLREIGKGFVYIYDNDTLMFEPIPWDSTHMNTIIDSSWNSKGVYWIDDKLVIGSASNTDTGFFLAYDVEHNIKVKFSGNKQCLGSTDTVKFEMSTPELFTTTLTFTTPNTGNRYHTGDDIDNLSLTYNCDSGGSDKTVKIYEGDTLLSTESCDDGDAVTVDVGVLSDGLHNLKAVFDGDDESTYAETILSISVGYKVIVTDYPSTSMNGQRYTVKCRVTDYLDEPLVGGTVVGVMTGEADPISDSATTGSDGTASLSNYYFGANDCKVKYNVSTYNYYSSAIDTTYVVIDGVAISSYTPSNKVIAVGHDGTLRGYTTNNGVRNQVANIPVHVGTIYGDTVTNYTDSDGYFTHTMTGNGRGDIYYNVHTGHDWSVSTQSDTIEDVEQYWKKGDAWNQEYSLTNGVLTSVQTGHKLSMENSSNPVLKITDKDASSLEFTIVRLNNILSFKVGSDLGSYQTLDVSVGDVVRMVKGKSTYNKSSATYHSHFKIYVNDVEVYDNLGEECSGYKISYLSGWTSSNKCYLILNNLKLKKV